MRDSDGYRGKSVGYAIDGVLTTTAADHLGSTEITNTGGTISSAKPIFRSARFEAQPPTRWVPIRLAPDKSTTALAYSATGTGV